MQELLEALSNLLERQDELISGLISLGKSQLKAMRANDLAELARVTSEQQELSARLVYLEGERVEIQHRLGLLLHKTGSEVTLKEILERADVNRERLEALAKRLTKNYEELRDLNEINRLLIRQSLSFVNKILTALAVPERTYSPSQSQLALSGGNLVDCTV